MMTFNPVKLSTAQAVTCAVLAKVIEYPASTAPGSARTAFSLFLDVDRDDAREIESGTYVLENDSIGSVGPVHIERILGADPKTLRLEVAFN